MQLLVMDIEGEAVGLDLALRAQDWGHEVNYWVPPRVSGAFTYGEGLVDRPEDWEPLMDSSDLVVLTGNSRYTGKLAEYFGRGYPIFGANERAAELELDREKGQEVLEKAGIATLPYVVVDGVEEGIAHIVREQKPIVIKPWGGEGDKALTFVTDTPDDAIFTLKKWAAQGLEVGQLMLQDKVDGVEIGIAGWFGPGGWCKWKEESFEHKKFMNDDLGENTGEQGTVLRHVEKSKLFDLVLEPLTEYLHSVRYVGDCSVNCIVDGKGRPWPLEFTARLGWPDFAIRYEVIPGDPIQWMRDLLQGKDSFAPDPEVAVGIVLSHGDYPKGGDPLSTWEGYPIRGVRKENLHHLHWHMVKLGETPEIADGAVQNREALVTAGNYVAVATGKALDVEGAAQKALAIAKEISWPSNVMYRTDIGARLREQLPQLQRHGFAKGMTF